MNDTAPSSLSPEQRCQLQTKIMVRLWSVLESDERFSLFNLAELKRDAVDLVVDCSDEKLVANQNAEIVSTDILGNVWASASYGFIKAMVDDHIDNLFASYPEFEYFNVHWDIIIMRVLLCSKWRDILSFNKGGPKVMASWNENAALYIACHCMASAVTTEIARVS